MYRGLVRPWPARILGKKHSVEIGREALRQIIMGGGLWRHGTRAEGGEDISMVGAAELPGRVRDSYTANHYTNNSVDSRPNGHCNLSSC